MTFSLKVCWTCAPRALLQQCQSSTRKRCLTPTSYIVYFTAAFILVPGGRDIFAPGKVLMPGDDKLIASMNPRTGQPGSTFMWQVWGSNWWTISAMKILAVYTGAFPFLCVSYAHVIVGVGFLVYYLKPMGEAGADIKPFLILFVLEAIGLSAILFL